MIIKDIICEDFVNYKDPSMFIIFPSCTFKCDIENGCQYCQNWSLVKEPNIEISIPSIIDKYINNPITSAVVCGGLEPFDSWDDLYELIKTLRESSQDDFIIYTGYYKEEIADKIHILSGFKNIIIKFGRFRPDETPHYDGILGVDLASDNQYAERIS